MQEIADVYEKLGTFYLGKMYDVPANRLEDQLLLYDSRDLVTHAVCVGMTGSGKTGLGITLLEEAAIDRIPALVIDPKGDLTNLLLQFPELRAEDFEPWINPDDASRQGLSPADFAAAQAELWRSGLASWGQSPLRIERLASACDYHIFTPGSDAGTPVSILSSFASPSAAVRQDADLLRDRISTTVTSILQLLGIDADPIRSREHILLTTILDHAWHRNISLDLHSLIASVQKPPVTKVGVMDLDLFFPSPERFELAMAMNNLLAAPGFSAWLTGAPLDVDRLLYTDAGKPRISIFYIAHLSESERLFFVSLLLNQVLSWMRSCSGTTSLRALLYMDEIFGYLPPVAEPPTKKPLLTLLKQARAYGLGLVLATQNPVDLDYKGLSNAGTWFLGRLQTDRDKQRVLDGLEGASVASGGFDRREMDRMLSGVGKRVFLMHNVHESVPVTFHTRWALSYLAGPLTRPQIKRLMAARGLADTATKTAAEPQPPRPAEPAVAVGGAVPATSTATSPLLPPHVQQVFLPPRRAAGNQAVLYEPRLLAVGRVHFVNTRKGLAADRDVLLLAQAQIGPLGIDWQEAVPLDLDPAELGTGPPLPGQFAAVPPSAAKRKSYVTWKKELANHIYRSWRYPLFRSALLDEVSRPGETERDFRIRLREAARVRRDDQVEKLRRKFASRIESLEERLRKAELRVRREVQEAAGAKVQSAISIGATILSAVLGRKTLSSRTVGRATTAARGVGRAQRQSEDVRRANADVEAYEDKLRELEEELEREVDELEDKFEVEGLDLDTIKLKPRKSDIDIRQVVLAWAPFAVDAHGERVPLFR